MISTGKSRSKLGALILVLLAVFAFAAACSDSDDDDDVATDNSGDSSAPDPSQSSGPVRGFDGETITVAGFGIKQHFQGAEYGARARIKRFNDTNEIPGITIDYAEMADDKIDPTVALSEARRLVDQVGVFAIVGDVSANNPGDYFNEQHVPYFGQAYDYTYCSREVTTELYGFGFNGCNLPDDPMIVPDTTANFYTYVAEKTGKEHPTIAIFSNENTSGQITVKAARAYESGAGFEVVYAESLLPSGAVGDFTPYVQEFLTADDGNPPDAIHCLTGPQCIQIYGLLKANGYEGTFLSALYSDALAGPMEGSATMPFFVNFAEQTPAIQQLAADLKAVEPDAPLDSSVVTGYVSTDMFIQALKTVAAEGLDQITPEAVQAAAATQTWEMEGLAGPVRYPESTAAATPQCTSVVVSDGTAWKTVVPYTCSEKTYPVE